MCQHCYLIEVSTDTEDNIIIYGGRRLMEGRQIVALKMRVRFPQRREDVLGLAFHFLRNARNLRAFSIADSQNLYMVA